MFYPQALLSCFFCQRKYFKDSLREALLQALFPFQSVQKYLFQALQGALLLPCPLPLHHQPFFFTIFSSSFSFLRTIAWSFFSISSFFFPVSSCSAMATSVAYFMNNFFFCSFSCCLRFPAMCRIICIAACIKARRNSSITSSSSETACFPAPV